MDTNIQSNGPGGVDALPSHVARFKELTEALDVAVREKNEQRVQQLRTELSSFYATLDSAEQEDLRVFTEREYIGKVIEGERSRLNRAFNWVLHAPHRLIHKAKEPVARLTGETIELIFMTLGWGVAGVIKGVRGAVDVVLRSATDGSRSQVSPALAT